MSKLFYKASIEDFTNKNCTEAKQEALLDCFEHTMKKTATTLARKAWFDLKDFATTKSCGIDNFSLLIERRKVHGQEQWEGTFEDESGQKAFWVLGTLEKN